MSFSRIALSMLKSTCALAFHRSELSSSGQASKDLSDDRLQWFEHSRLQGKRQPLLNRANILRIGMWLLRLASTSVELEH